MLSKALNICLLAMLSLLLGCQASDLAEPNNSIALEEEQLLARYQAEQAQLDQEIAAIEAEEIGTSRSTVTLEAGSVDGLQNAIDQAGPGGTVVLESGDHFESGTVLIEHQISIVGEEDARLVFETDPIEVLGFIEPALHFKNAPRSRVRGVVMEVSTEVGGAAIVLEDSDRTVITRNVISEYQFGILVQNSDFIYAIRNEIAASTLWQSQTIIVQSFGVVVANGSRARIYSNELSGGITGVWACDRLGNIAGNEFFGNLQGIILCKVPEEYSYLLPDGQLVAAESSATRWSVFNNDAHNNIFYGYQIIDGAIDNFLVKNQASNNGNGDYEFAGETTRFMLINPSPTSETNIAWIDNKNTYLDCGLDNNIFGGIEMDNTGDACF
ncbi:MAG: right-handed parallel beta-helix repeat-containing protein [Bacteroidota bacterium]